MAKLTEKEIIFIDGFLKEQDDFDFSIEKDSFYKFLFDIGVKNENTLNRMVLNRWSIKTYYERFKNENIIRSALKELGGITQRELSELLGVHIVSVQKWQQENQLSSQAEKSLNYLLQTYHLKKNRSIEWKN